VKNKKVKKMKEKLLKTGFVLVIAISVVLCASMATVAAPPPLPKPPYMQLSADPPAIVADGSSTSVVNASVWVWDKDDEEYWPIIGPVVEFSTDLGEITTPATIENATATAILTAGTVEGIATITAEVDLGEEGIIKNTTTVNLTAPEDGGDDNDGNGGGGNGGNGGGGTTTTPTPTAGETTTPTPDATATPAVSPTVSPTETGTATATESPTPSPSPTKKPLIPGFEAVFVIAGLLTVAYLVLGRKRK
jgi:cell division septation protein DedD